MDLAWETSGGDMAILSFDATVREVIGGTATVTEHAVETGADVADHVRVGARKVSLECYVSDSPGEAIEDHTDASGSVQAATLSAKGRELKTPARQRRAAEYQAKAERVTARVLQFSGALSRRRRVYEQLEDLRARATLINGFGILGADVAEMVITSLSAPLDSKSGEGISFSLELSAVRFAESQIVDVPAPVEPRGRTTVDAGATATTESAEPESLWHAIAGL